MTADRGTRRPERGRPIDPGRAAAAVSEPSASPLGPAGRRGSGSGHGLAGRNYVKPLACQISGSPGLAWARSSRAISTWWSPYRRQSTTLQTAQARASWTMDTPATSRCGTSPRPVPGWAPAWPDVLGRRVADAGRMSRPSVSRLTCVSGRPRRPGSGLDSRRPGSLSRRSVHPRRPGLPWTAPRPGGEWRNQSRQVSAVRVGFRPAGVVACPGCMWVSQPGSARAARVVVLGS